jgi:signal transduction histidine kinase
MLDPKTLSLLIAIGNLAFAALVTVYLRSATASNRALRIWRWSKVITACGYLANIFRDNLAMLPPGFGNMLQLAGYTLEFIAYLALFQRSGMIRWAAVFGGVAISLLALISLLGLGQGLRLGVFSLAIALLVLGMSGVLLASKHKTPLVWVLSCFDLIAALIMFLRVVYGFFITPLATFEPTLINLAVYLMAYLLLIINGFGFLLLTKQEDDRRLQTALAELRTREADQRRFIAMLSHEVRSPIAVINATAQLLSLQETQNNYDQTLIARIRRGATRLASFFENSLTADRISQGRLTPSLTSIEVAQLTAWVNDMAPLLSEQHNLNTSAEDNLPPLNADPELLRILLSNLISNAVKYSPEGAEIEVAFRRDHAGCAITVCDQGPGIPEEEFAIIFERYRRGRSAERKPGAGLGLNIVQHIVALHGGTLSASNRPEGGCCFTVVIPFQVNSRNIRQ